MPERQAILTTGLKSIRLSDDAFYAIVEFETEGEPVAVVVPPDFLPYLAAMALAVAPQAAELPDDQLSLNVFKLTGGTVYPVEGGDVVLLAEFAKGSRIQFHIEPGLGRSLAAALAQHLPETTPSGKGPQRSNN